jgi:hypothetical protein
LKFSPARKPSAGPGSVRFLRRRSASEAAAEVTTSDHRAGFGFQQAVLGGEPRGHNVDSLGLSASCDVGAYTSVGLSNEKDDFAAQMSRASRTSYLDACIPGRAVV